MQRILITGGLGYVGGRVTQYLRTTFPDWNLRLLTTRGPDRTPSWSAGLELVHGDVRDPDTLVRAVEGVDAVVHLAGANELVTDPTLSVEINGLATGRLLEAGVRAGVRRFLYFSTFHVYGRTRAALVTEETATRPLTPYAFSHRLAEDYVNWYRETSGLEGVNLRLSNGFGYPMNPEACRWNLVVNDLCRRAVQDQRLVVRTPHQSRNFITIQDVARAVGHLLAVPAERLGDGTFNLGGEFNWTIGELARRVADEYRLRYGRALEIEEPPLTEGAPVAGRVVFDVSRLRGTGFALEGRASDEIRGTFDLAETLARS